MTRKVKSYVKHRYTKKSFQTGGGDDEYTVTAKTVEMKQSLVNYLKTLNSDSVILEQKVTKITVPKKMKDAVELELLGKANVVNGVKTYDFNKVGMGMCLMNCDYMVTSPIEENFDSDVFKKAGIKTPPVPSSYITRVKVSPGTMNKVKYYAKTNNLIVNDSKGNKVPELTDAEASAFDEKNTQYTDVKYDEQRFADLYHMLIVSNPLPFDETKKTSLKLILPMPSDQRKKEELYNILSTIDKKIELLCSLTSVDSSSQLSIEEIKEHTKNVEKIKEHNKNVDEWFYAIDDQTREEMKKKKLPEDCLTLKHALVQSIASDIFVIQDNFANESSESVIEKMDFKITKNLADSSGWWLGKLPLFLIEKILETIRSSMRNYGKMSFSSDEAARKMLNQKRADAVKGVKNEFSLMSAFVGTEAQKTAAKTGIILGIASTCWAIVGKIQQNPALAAVVVGAVSATGVGGIAIGGALIACGVAYYAVLKLKEKYNSYYEINRSLNELTILLHRIQKLIRLSVLVSNTYNFDIAINEIVEQLKILFSRFDEILKQDDYNGIQGMINTNATPDLDMVKVVEKAAVEAAAENEERKKIADAELQNMGFIRRNYEKTKEKVSSVAKAVGNAFKKAGKNIGSFIYVMTFDQDLWYKKLNNDIIKLNIYLTTTIGEFNLVLNVLQMEYITKGFSKDPVVSSQAITSLTDKQNHIKGSSEYMRMLIGILLNDILKLRVDLSYCSRKNIAAIVKVSTKDEPICLGYQDTDGAGNIVSTYRKNLHAMILTLVKRLNDPNSVYSTSKGLKEKVEKEVIEPYTVLFENHVKVGIPPDIITAFKDSGVKLTFLNKDFFTKKFDETAAKLNSKLDEKAKQRFDTKKQMELSKIKGNNPPKGGGDPDTKAKETSKETASSAETDEDKLNKLMDGTVEYIVTEPYVTIPDKELSEFLNKVYEFSKKEGKTTEAETADAIKTAKQIADIAPSAKASAIAAATLAAESQADTEQKNAAELAKYPPNVETTTGGRRLTRKRVSKKNRRKTRGLKAAPFKSAAAALKAYNRR